MPSPNLSGRTPIVRAFIGNGGQMPSQGTTQYDALSELAGKPLPIYEGGAWEDLQPKTGIGWEMPVGIYRYTKENK